MSYSASDLMLYYFIDLIKLLIIIGWIMGFSFKKNKALLVITLVPVIVIHLLSQFNLNDNKDLVESILPITLLLVLLFLIQEKIIRKLLFITSAYIMAMFLDICVSAVFSIRYNMTLEYISDSRSLYLACNSLSVLIVAMVGMFLKLRKRDFLTKRITARIYALLISGAFVGVFYISGLIITKIPGTEEKARNTILIIIIMVCVIYFTVCFMLVYISESRDRFKALSQINQAVIEAQQRYYILSNEKQQEIRSIRHEMRNHIFCISSLYNQNKKSELEKYLNELIEQTKMLPELFDTGNDIVNAILNDAQSRYQKDGINILLEGGFPENLHITSMDLCTIFANAINNAVEAILSANQDMKKQSSIQVKIRSFKEDLFIDISNPVFKNVNIINGRLITTKEDKDYHGFGTENMRKKVLKYQGTIDFLCEDNLFTVEIHMKNIPIKE